MAKPHRYCPRVVTKFPLEGSEASELSFHAGDFIRVEREQEGAWWFGEHEKTGQLGLFPVNYVGAVDDFLCATVHVADMHGKLPMIQVSERQEVEEEAPAEVVPLEVTLAGAEPSVTDTVEAVETNEPEKDIATPIKKVETVKYEEIALEMESKLRIYGPSSVAGHVEGLILTAAPEMAERRVVLFPIECFKLEHGENDEILPTIKADLQRWDGRIDGLAQLRSTCGDIRKSLKVALLKFQNALTARKDAVMTKRALVAIPDLEDALKAHDTLPAAYQPGTFQLAQFVQEASEYIPQVKNATRVIPRCVQQCDQCVQWIESVVDLVDKDLRIAHASFVRYQTMLQVAELPHNMSPAAVTAALVESAGEGSSQMRSVEEEKEEEKREAEAEAEATKESSSPLEESSAEAIEGLQSPGDRTPNEEEVALEARMEHIEVVEATAADDPKAGEKEM